MNEHDLVLVLHEEGMLATRIDERFVEPFDPLAIAYSKAMRTIRQVSWSVPRMSPKIQEDSLRICNKMFEFGGGVFLISWLLFVRLHTRQRFPHPRSFRV
jgi:hypothetical protein